MTVIDFRHTAPTRAASSLWRARIPPCPYSPDTAPHGAKQGAKRWRVNGRGKKSALSLYCVLASDMRQGATPVISSSVDRGHRLRSKWVRASARIAGHPAAPSLTKSDRRSACPACPACPACLPCLLALPACPTCWAGCSAFGRNTTKAFRWHSTARQTAMAFLPGFHSGTCRI